MALVFTDDFTRANGGIGGTWTGHTSSYFIDTNRCYSNTTLVYQLLNSVDAGAPDMHVEATIDSTTTYQSSRYLSIAARRNVGDGSGYMLRLQLAPLPTSELRLSVTTNVVSDQVIATFQVPSPTAGDHVLGLTVEGDLITCWFDGEVFIQLQDNRVTTGDYFGFYISANSTVYLKLFDVYDQLRQAMSASPPTILAGVDGQLVGLYGYGTQWTPGTPGDPEFTINAGSIVGQTIYTGTAAGITINAPATEQILIITDPNYGRTAHVRVTQTVVAPGGVPWDPLGVYPFIQRLNNQLQALLNTAALALTDGITLPEGESVLGWVRGIGDPPEGQNLASMLVTALRELQVDGDDPTTIRSVVVDLLAELYTTNGYPTRVTLQDILDAIAAIPGGGGGDLEELTQLCTDILAELYIIDGYATGRHTLQDILDAIALIPGCDVTQLEADVAQLLLDVGSANSKLDSISGNGSNTLGSILSAISAMRGAGDHTLDATWDRADAAASSAGTAVVEIGLVAAAIALLPGAIGVLLTAQTVEIVAAITAATAEINAATAAEAATINANIALARGDIAGVDSHLDDIENTLGQMSLMLGQLVEGNHNYPGPMGVDFDEAIAISGDMFIDQKVDGAVYDITAAPARLGRWTSGDAVDYFHLGWAAFVSGDGYYDDYQQVKWNHGLLLPKTVASPAGLVIHWAPGVTGTVTPWVRSGS